jgi:hypothetical protein
MSHRLVKLMVVGGFTSLLVLFVSGCTLCRAGKPGPLGRYTIEVSLDESLKSSSVIVDLVGVNPSNLPRWEAYDMAKYWREGDVMRRDGDKVVLNFVSGQAMTQTLPVKDPKWNEWKSRGVSHVLVLADLPGTIASRPGNQDARRQILSLDKCNWPGGTKELKLLVQRSGIVVLTPLR